MDDEERGSMTTYQTWGNWPISPGLTYDDAKYGARESLLNNVRREHGVQEIGFTETSPTTKQWIRYAGPRDDIHALLKAEPERIKYHRWTHGGVTNVQAVYEWEEA